MCTIVNFDLKFHIILLKLMLIEILSDRRFADVKLLESKNDSIQ